MLNEVWTLVSNPSKQGPRLAVRLALVFAGLGILWTVLVVGVVFAFAAFDAWLTPRIGKEAALAVAGCSGILAAGTGLFLSARRSTGTQSTIPFDPALLRRYPIESATLALAAGVLASRLDVAGLARPALEALLRERR